MSKLSNVILTVNAAVLAFTTLSVNAESIVIFSDDFESKNLSTGEWVNTGNGALKVHTIAANEGVYGARLNRGAGLETHVNTKGYSALELSYARRTANLSDGQALTVEWSNDRHSWHRLEQVASAEWENKSFNIELDNKEEIFLRFAVNSKKNIEQAHIDDVVLKARK